MPNLNRQKQRFFSTESIVVLVALIVVIGLTILMVMLTRKESDGLKQSESVIPRLTEKEFIQATTFDPDSISEYSASTDCWIIYNDAVYDVASILNKVPEVKSNGCGKTYTTELSSKSITAMAPYLVAYTQETVND